MTIYFTKLKFAAYSPGHTRLGLFIALVGISTSRGFLLFVGTIMPRKVETNMVQMRGKASTISGRRV